MEGQWLLQFGVMIMFAAPLLHLSKIYGNFGFEFVGRPERGKSSVQRLMSSVAGGINQGRDGHYFIDCDTTLAALEDTMKRHSDMALVMDETNLAGREQSPKEKAALFQAIAFKLSAGSTRDRKGQASQQQEDRMIYCLSANEPLATLIGKDSDSALAAADRLITIPLIPPSTPSNASPLDNAQM